jgi:hypothetical protein
MLKRGWGAVVAVGVLLASAGAARAQETDSARDQELQELKKRIEVLEQQRQADLDAREKHGADPADGKWYDRVSVGGGIRTSLSFAEEDSGNGKDLGKFVSLDSARIYLNAKITDVISATLNTEFDGGTVGPTTGAGVRILDAIVQFHFQDEFNLWVGHFLPPTDRFNLDGPYYLATWGGPGGFPIVGDPYSNIFAGRDNGVAVWGDVAGGKFKYQVGLFNGNIPSAVNHTDKPEVAIRLTYEVLDPEPGYYTQSTYYGQKDVLAISGVLVWQKEGAFNPGGPGSSGSHDVTGGNFDVLFEKKLSPDMGGGAITVEAAIYWTDTVVAGDVWAGRATSYYIGVYYLLPGKVGWGQFQPIIDYQVVDQHGSRNLPDTDEFDLGVNYIIKGHDARISLTWSRIQITPRGAATALGVDNISRQLVLGLQVQF